MTPATNALVALLAGAKKDEKLVHDLLEPCPGEDIGLTFGGLTCNELQAGGTRACSTCGHQASDGSEGYIPNTDLGSLIVAAEAKGQASIFYTTRWSVTLGAADGWGGHGSDADFQTALAHAMLQATVADNLARCSDATPPPYEGRKCWPDFPISECTYCSGTGWVLTGADVEAV